MSNNNCHDDQHVINKWVILINQGNSNIFQFSRATTWTSNLTYYYDHGHLASLHLNHRFWGLNSAKQQPGSLPLCCRCCLLSSLNPQHCNFLSRIKASSLYVGMLYLGCWTKRTFFHQSFIACRKQHWGRLTYCTQYNHKSIENIKQFLNGLMAFKRWHADLTKANRCFSYNCRFLLRNHFVLMEVKIGCISQLKCKNWLWLQPKLVHSSILISSQKKKKRILLSWKKMMMSCHQVWTIQTSGKKLIVKAIIIQIQIQRSRQ